MKNIFVINKKEGETPLEALENFRSKNKKYKNSKMTYAGRLDPMASGKLILLCGDETKNKEKYLKLDKEYKFSVLFGFATDTYDILGKCTRQGLVHGKIKEEIQKNIKSFIGKQIQKYPMYSSKTVKGKPLFSYARSGEEVEIPQKEIFIKKIKFNKIKKINNKNLYKNIEKRIKKVNGDFRQEEILKIWKDNLLNNKNEYFIADFKVECSSGTYVRSISYMLGDKIGIPSLAFSIKRTRFINMI